LDGSFSRKLTQAIVDKLKHKHAQSTQVTVRDLVVHPLPHLNPEHLAAFFDQKQEEKKKLVLRDSEACIAELLDADVLVLGVAMHNFSIPSVLKSWIDHVARAGRTFRYGS